MSEETASNVQNEIKKEPLDEINYVQNNVITPELTDYTNVNLKVKLETEDLHHAIDIKEEVSESPQVEDEAEREASLASHSESDDSVSDFLHRKRKARDEDASKKYYQYKLLKLNRRIEQEQLLFDLQQKIHQKTLERLKLDRQHQNEILKMDEKIQKTANKIKQLKKLKK